METMAMIDNFKEAQACLVHGSMDSTDEIRELVEAYVRLCSLQYDHQLFHACLRTIDMGIKVIGKRESDSELCLLKAELMLFRGNAMWELKEYSMDELMDVNNEALQFIEVKMKNKLDRLENVIRMYDLRIKIFKYYNQQDQLSIYQQLKTNMENEYNKLQDEEEKMEYSMPHRIPKRIENHVEKRSYSVRVKVIMSQTYQLLIPCHDMYKTVECLMSEISKRTWDLYGIEPHIQRLTTMDCDLYKKDLLRDVIKNDNQYMEAHANGSVTKSPYDLYTNACERLKITTSKTIADHLEGQQSSHNSFKGLNIGGEQRTVIAQVIKHIPDPNIVDLSSNNLDDGAVELLLQDAKAISELNLTNNHLTTATVRMLIRSLPNGLQKLKLSYNRIGPDMLIELPDLFKAFPHLRLLELEGTYIGKYTDYSCKMDPMDGDVEYMDEDTNEFFQPSLVLKLGHNHFDKRVFSKWIDSLSRIHILNELNLTGITSDQPLPSFDLCRLSSLNILNLAKCSRRVFSLNSLNYMMFNHPSLSEIDVSYWNLSVEDVDTLFDGIDLNPHMKSIHLRYNPGVGDKGILKLSDLLYGANVQMLDIAGCQLTKYSMDIIMDWIRNGRFMEIDMTDNNQLITSNDQLMQFIKEYDGSRLVIRMSAEVSSFDRQ
ncbi:hypothetical protein BDB01DRAFT_87560 [Pilobolus umbonatus]|nr:hypothetical protein BDB01DRAFT_87560 [Pilobolus umbonatus]